MGGTEGRVGIEALVARGRATFEGVPRNGLAYAMADALERQQAAVDRLREDMMDAVEGLGVRPICYNGLHRAWLNQTNADVKTFKTAKECAEWCAETNRRLDTENLEQTGNHISTQFERQQAVVEAAREVNSQQDGSDMRGAVKDPPSEDVLVALDIALAALDVPPEGGG